MSLLGGDDSSIWHSRKDLRITTHRFNNRRADKDRVVIFFRPGGLFKFRDIKVRFKRIDLTTEGITLHFDIHQLQQRLVTADIFGKKYRACARAPDRMA